jgi:hypothetical protein
MSSPQFHCCRARFSSDPTSGRIEHIVLEGNESPYMCGDRGQAKQWLARQISMNTHCDADTALIVTRPGTHSLPRSGNVSNCYLGWSYFKGNDHPFLLEQLLPAAGEGQTAYQLKRRPFGNLLRSIGGGAETDSAWPSWLRVTRSLSNAPSNVDKTIRWRMKNGQGVGDQVYRDLSPPLDPIFFLPQETQSRDSGSSGQIPHVSPGVSSIWSYRDPNGSFVPGPTTLPSPSGSGQSSQSSPSGNSAWTSVGHMWIGEKG